MDGPDRAAQSVFPVYELRWVFQLRPAPKGKVAKAKAKTKGKKGNPVATFDLRKAKLSHMDKPFPIVDRAETIKLAENQVIMAEACWQTFHAIQPHLNTGCVAQEFLCG